MRTLESVQAEIVANEQPSTKEVVASPELVAEVEAAFTQSVEALAQVAIDPEREHEMGAIYKPVISTDWTKGARR